MKEKYLKSTLEQILIIDANQCLFRCIFLFNKLLIN